MSRFRSAPTYLRAPASRPPLCVQIGRAAVRPCPARAICSSARQDCRSSTESAATREAQCYGGSRSGSGRSGRPVHAHTDQARVAQAASIGACLDQARRAAPRPPRSTPRIVTISREPSMPEYVVPAPRQAGTDSTSGSNNPATASAVDANKSSSRNSCATSVPGSGNSALRRSTFGCGTATPYHPRRLVARQAEAAKTLLSERPGCRFPSTGGRPRSSARLRAQQ
jgi:hypothetical protein